MQKLTGGAKNRCEWILTFTAQIRILWLSNSTAPRKRIPPLPWTMAKFLLRPWTWRKLFLEPLCLKRTPSFRYLISWNHVVFIRNRTRLSMKSQRRFLRRRSPSTCLRSLRSFERLKSLKRLVVQYIFPN